MEHSLKYTGKLRFLPLTLCLFAALGCSVRHQHTHPVPTLHRQPEAGDDANSARWIAKNCPFGLPENRSNTDLGPTTVVFREGYVLLHSSADRISLYVCEGINNEQIVGPGDRDKSNWTADPDITGAKAVDDDYKHSGFDRGHMTPAMNHKRTQKLMDETHYLSNAVPQVGPKFNQSVWRVLEQRVQGWIEPTPEAGDTELFIITGPIFWEAEEDNPDTADGEVPIFVIGENEVSVPTHLYKIVVQAMPDQEPRAVAIVMTNQDHESPADYASFIKPISWIEERTGINFMPELDEDPELRNRLETVNGTLFDE